MTKYNPFIDEEEEEKVYFPKPRQKLVLTKDQKARNAKGIKMFLESLKKIKTRRFYE